MGRDGLAETSVLPVNALEEQYKGRKGIAQIISEQ